MKAGVIVNVRPANYRDRFHEAFAPIGWTILDSPVLVPESMNAVTPDPGGFDAVIFTSQVAVETLGEGWRDKTAFAVGAATAEAARRAGFTRTVQTGLDSKDLAAALAAAGFRQALYPSAEDVSADVSLDDPVRIRRIATYRMSASAHLSAEVVERARARETMIIPLFSRRSARTVQDLLAKAGLTAQNAVLGAVAISPDVFPGEPGPWQRRSVADKPTLEAVVAASATMAEDLIPEATR
ncbi:MAG: uroporphyrinogen-III synthase [Rhodospirillaceae bacterium]